MTTIENKAVRVEAILEAMGFAWSMDLADAVRNRLRTCDGKDTPRQVAAYVAKNIKANA